MDVTSFWPLVLVAFLGAFLANAATRALDPIANRLSYPLFTLILIVAGVMAVIGLDAWAAYTHYSNWKVLALGNAIGVGGSALGWGLWRLCLAMTDL